MLTCGSGGNLLWGNTLYNTVLTPTFTTNTYTINIATDLGATLICTGITAAATLNLSSSASVGSWVGIVNKTNFTITVKSLPGGATVYVIPVGGTYGTYVKMLNYTTSSPFWTVAP